jgi:hypothetical protein
MLTLAARQTTELPPGAWRPRLTEIGRHGVSVFHGVFSDGICDGMPNSVLTKPAFASGAYEAKRQWSGSRGVGYGGIPRRALEGNSVGK